jgi:Flp pilus assembly CpaF family ATPase
MLKSKYYGKKRNRGREKEHYSVSKINGVVGVRVDSTTPFIRVVLPTFTLRLFYSNTVLKNSVGGRVDSTTPFIRVVLPTFTLRLFFEHLFFY